MNRIFIFVSDPWHGSRDIVRDVTDLTVDQLRSIFDTRPSNFDELMGKAREHKWTPGQILAAWVAEVGPDYAGFVIHRRRLNWLNRGAAVGIVLGMFPATFLWVWPLQDYIREALSPGILTSLLYWSTSVAGLLLPGLCFGAGAGWIAGWIVDVCENLSVWRSYRSYESGNSEK